MNTTRGLTTLAVATVLLAASCADDDVGVSTADDTVATIPVTTTLFSKEDFDRRIAACEVASDIEAPHEWIGTSIWTVGDVDRDLVPAAAIAAWEDLDPSTPVTQCSYALHECDDPLAISAIQHIFVTNYSRVDFAEPETTDCNVYAEDVLLQYDAQPPDDS